MIGSLLLVAGAFLVDRFSSYLVAVHDRSRREQPYRLAFRFLQLRERYNHSLSLSHPTKFVEDFCAPMEQERTLSLEEAGLSATATPAEMIACLQARKAAKEAAKIADSTSRWVGGAEEIRLSEDLKPLGKYEVFQHDPLFRRVLAGRIGTRNATLNPFVEQVDVLEGTPLTFEGFRDGKSLPTFLTLPIGSTESLRKLAEAGYRNVDVSALDIHIQSHVGQGSPVTATIALMDARWGDNWQRSMLACGEFDLGEGKPRLFVLPLVNLSVGTLVDDFDQCPLYLSISYNGLSPSWKGHVAMTVGEIRFGEFYRVSYSPYTRMKESFDAILSSRESSRIVAGLHSLKMAELDYSETLPESEKDFTIWTRPGKVAPILVDSKATSFARGSLCRSVSTINSVRQRAPPRNSVEFSRWPSNSVNNWVKQQASLSVRSAHDICCDSDASGNMLNVAESTATYADVGAKVLIQGLAEPAPVVRMKLRQTSLPILQNSFISETSVSKGMEAVEEGGSVFTYSLKTLLTKGGHLVAQRLAQIGSAKLTIRADISLTVPAQTIGLFKAVYDMSSSIKGTGSFHGLSHLPGPVIDGVNEAKMSVLMTPLVLGQGTNLKSGSVLGQLVIGALIKPQAGTQSVMTTRVRFYVHSIDSWHDSALGDSFCFSGSNFSVVPGSMYIGDPTISVSINVDSAIGTQWRAPILPNRGIWRPSVWYPNCSSSLLENYRFWRGKCYFRYYIVAPPLSRGLFAIVALPPGKFTVVDIAVDRIYSSENGITPFVVADVDLTNNRHGYLEVDFTSWHGYFPAGCSANSYGDVSGCPWMGIVQLSNLTSLNKDFNKFHIYLELVEIKDCLLDGPSFVPITRLNLPSYAKSMYAPKGNASSQDADWMYAGILTKWPSKNKVWVSFPVTPLSNIFPVGFTSTEITAENAYPNLLVHRAMGAMVWQGGMAYKFLLNKTKPLLGAYTSLALGEFQHGFMSYGGNTPNPLRGNQTIFGTDRSYEHSCELVVPGSVAYNYMWCGIADTTAKRSYMYNGWVFLCLPPWQENLTCMFLTRVLADFKFGGYRPPSQVTTTTVEPVEFVFS